MADSNTSIFTVKLNAEDFSKFQANFSKFDKATKNIPGAWKLVTDAIEKAEDPADALAKKIREINEGIEGVNGTVNDIAPKFGGANISAEKFGKTVKGIFEHVGGTAKLLAGFAAGMAGFGAVGMGLPLWFADRLAGQGQQQFLSSTRSNLSAGQMTAFQNDVTGRTGIGSNILSSMLDLQTSPNGSMVLNRGMGTTGVDTDKMDTSEIFVKTMENLRTQMKGKSMDQIKQVLAQTGLSAEGFGVGDALAIQHMSDSQFGGMVKQYQGDSNTENPNNPNLQQFTQLKIAMDNAESKFMAAVINNGGPVAKGLTDLTNSLSDLAMKAMNSGPVKKWFTDFGAGLEALSDAANKGGVGGLVKMFADGAALFGKAIATDFYRGGQVIGKAITDSLSSLFGGTASPYVDSPDHFVPDAYRTYNSGSAKLPVTQAAFRTYGGSSGGGSGGSGQWGGLNAQAGLPSGFLETVEHMESNGNPFAQSGAGAQGAFQFMPKTWQQYGQGSVWNENNSANAAAKYFSQLAQQFHGNIDQMLAAYNDGPGNVQAAIGKFGPNWEQAMPDETKSYIKKYNTLQSGGGPDQEYAARLSQDAANKARQGRGTLSITIHNKTGGDVSLTTASFM